MPIKIPDKLPATARLRKENIFVMVKKGYAPRYSSA